jgi:hypothetical protein
VIPSSVVVVGKWSFDRCSWLEYVSFEYGSRLERIEESAFSRSRLNAIIIPLSVRVLGKESFSSCQSLDFVVFEKGSRLERIEESAFSESGLRSIEIPGHVAWIVGSAFSGVSPNSISMSPDNVTFRLRGGFLEDSEGSRIYRYCGAFRSVVIPSSVIVLDKSSFDLCTCLEYVIFERGSRLEAIEERAFHASGLKSVVIPSLVLVLGEFSFAFCRSLESVVFEIGSRLGRIEKYAFAWSRVESIVIPPSVAFIDDSAFFWTPFHLGV